jgi:hypothetical protein
MKKYILSLCALVSIGQCYSMEDKEYTQAHQAIVTMYNIIKNADVKRAPQDLFIAWNQTISHVTSYAINNSKNALGQQDMGLITTATIIRDVNNEIINLYKNLQQDILSKTLKKNSSVNKEKRYYYEVKATNLKKQLDNQIPKLTVYHMSTPKKKAQSVLRETVKYLRPILDLIKEKVDGIPIALD